MAINLNTIECKECGHQNEPERIFCHNCGVKLDRENAPALKKAEQPESPKEIKKRITKAVTPSRGIHDVPFGKFLKPLAGTVVFAAVAAALFLAALPPDDAAPVSKKPELAGAPDLAAGLEAAGGWNLAKSFDIPESQINAYLQDNVRQKKDASLAQYIPFRKCYIHLDIPADKGAAHVRCIAAYAILDYPIYITDICTFQIANHQLTATVLGGSIGKLAIHPRLAQYLGIVFQPALESLKRERALMDKLQSVEVLKGLAKEGVVRITTAPVRH